MDKPQSDERSWLITGFSSAVTALTSLVLPILSTAHAIKNKTRVQLPFIHASLALLGTLSAFFSIFAFKEAIKAHKAQSQNDKAEKRSDTALNLTEEPSALTPTSLRESAGGHCRWQSSTALSKDTIKDASNSPDR